MVTTLTHDTAGDAVDRGQDALLRQNEVEEVPELDASGERIAALLYELVQKIVLRVLPDVMDRSGMAGLRRSQPAFSGARDGDMYKAIARSVARMYVLPMSRVLVQMKEGGLLDSGAIHLLTVDAQEVAGVTRTYVSELLSGARGVEARGKKRNAHGTSNVQDPLAS